MAEERGSGPRPENRKDGEGNRGGRGRRFNRRRFGRGKPGDRPAEGEAAPQAAPAEESRQPAPREDRPREDRPRDDRPREERGREGRAAGNSGRDNRGEARPPARPERDRDENPPEKADPVESPLCPLCQKPVIDLSTAVAADRESGAPAHFDCVLERVAAAENLGPREKLVYLGSGSFAVIDQGERAEGAFTVKRRVQWEKEGEKKEWRRSIGLRMTKI